MVVPRSHLNGIFGANNGNDQLGALSLANASSAADNGTTPDDLEAFKKSVIYELLLTHDQSIRSFHIGLGAVALALAVLIIWRILYDAWRSSQLQAQLRPAKFTSFKWLKSIHSAEAFPLILFSGLIIQQLVFVPIQSTALNSVTVLGCTQTTQVVYPAIFIVVYIHVVFGLEMTFRSFSKTTFHPRRKWTSAICLGIVALLLLVTWIPTTIFKTRNRCVGSLVWWPIRYNIMSIAILGTAFVLFKIMALIIGLRLRRTMDVDPNERIAASRMVFYLNGASILNAFIIPFFIQAQLHSFDNKLTSSRLAELVFFGQGILLAVLHMIMRANAGRLVIKPKNAPWQKRRRFRLFGPSDLEILNISGPVGLIPRDNDSVENLPQQPEKALYQVDSDQQAWSPDRKTPPPFPTSRYFDQNASRPPGMRRAASPPRINTTMSPIKLAGGEESTGTIGSSRPLLGGPLLGEAPKWPLPLFPLTNPAGEATTSAETPKSAEPIKSAEAAQDSSPTKGHKRTRSNYSLFPSRESVLAPAPLNPQPKSQTQTPAPAAPEPTLQLPATVYTPPSSSKKATAAATLQPPAHKPKFASPSITDVSEVAFDLFPFAPPPRAPWEQHKRGVSTESSATVQIGLRLSTTQGPGNNSRNPLSPTKRIPTVMASPLQSPVARPVLQEEDSSDSLFLPREGPSAFKMQELAPLESMKQSPEKVETARAATDRAQSPLPPVVDKSLPPTPRVSTRVPSPPSTPPPRLERRSSDYSTPDFDFSLSPSERSGVRSPGPGFF